jgi:hypothetical protein
MNMRFSIRLAGTALAIAALAASIGWASVDALALTKKQSAINKCDRKYARCILKCDNLVDVYTQVRDCNNACIIQQSRCLLNAGLRVQDAPMLETQPDPLQSQWISHEVCIMKAPIFSGIILLFAFLAFSDAASALTKKQQTALDKCNHTLNVCNVDCDDYTNLNAKDSCLKRCARKYETCRDKVSRLGGFVLPENNITEQPDPSQSQWHGIDLAAPRVESSGKVIFEFEYFAFSRLVSGRRRKR